MHVGLVSIGICLIENAAATSSVRLPSCHDEVEIIHGKWLHFGLNSNVANSSIDTRYWCAGIEMKDSEYLKLNKYLLLSRSEYR
mmetsp:Transcript_23880/g.50805  ORF Transcript_23880/g.50805 Transcript_23880/m.50805 type:complete len:84 (+) Transcript_23880:1185-1436(+)